MSSPNNSNHLMFECQKRTIIYSIEEYGNKFETQKDGIQPFLLQQMVGQP